MMRWRGGAVEHDIVRRKTDHPPAGQTELPPLADRSHDRIGLIGIDGFGCLPR